MGYFREQNNLPSLLSIVYSNTTLLGGDGEGKLHFPLLKSAKRHKDPLRPFKAVQLILSPIEVMIGLVLFLARDFSNNDKPRQCKKIIN